MLLKRESEKRRAGVDITADSKKAAGIKALIAIDCLCAAVQCVRLKANTNETHLTSLSVRGEKVGDKEAVGRSWNSVERKTTAECLQACKGATNTGKRQYIEGSTIA